MAKLEIFYLAVVLTTFAVFMSVLAVASWDYERNKRRRRAEAGQKTSHAAGGQLHA